MILYKALKARCAWGCIIKTSRIYTSRSEFLKGFLRDPAGARLGGQGPVSPQGYEFYEYYEC
uniref:Uncharacterized protein n=1 Tax=Romanomermis culicivorax TaxID=13658 RepID=A0A915IAF4_ROMCU